MMMSMGELETQAAARDTEKFATSMIISSFPWARHATKKSGAV